MIYERSQCIPRIRAWTPAHSIFAETVSDVEEGETWVVILGFEQ